MDGVQVTDVARTALDLARSLPFEPAVVAVDAALHEGLLTRDLLEGRLFDIAGTRGSRHAARVIRAPTAAARASGRAGAGWSCTNWGSPLSTAVRGSVIRRWFVARTDFAWEEHRVIGEFDGRVKYGRLLRPDQDPGDAVFEEKRREDAIRDESWEVVRWTWSDLSRPEHLGDRVRRARERGLRRGS